MLNKSADSYVLQKSFSHCATGPATHYFSETRG